MLEEARAVLAVRDSEGELGCELGDVLGVGWVADDRPREPVGAPLEAAHAGRRGLLVARGESGQECFVGAPHARNYRRDGVEGLPLLARSRAGMLAHEDG